MQKTLVTTVLKFHASPHPGNNDVGGEKCFAGGVPGVTGGDAYICVHTKYQRMFGPAVPCPPPPEGRGVLILTLLNILSNWQVRLRPRPVHEAGVTRGQVRSFALFFKDQVKQFALVVEHVLEIEFCVKLDVFEN